MKAAIITAFDLYHYKGGIERYILQLIRLLERQGIVVDIYHTALVDDDMGLHYRLMGKMFALGQKFYQVDRNYDFMVSNSFYGFGYFPPRIKSFNIYHSTHVAFDKSAKGVISHVTSLEFTYLCGYFGEMVSGFDRIKIAVSENVKGELEKYYGFNEVRAVESGVDTALFKVLRDKSTSRRKYSIPTDAFVGLFVGRWDKTKGKDIVEKTIEKTPDIHWLLVLGTGSEECTLRKSKNVTILEEVPYEEMPLVYSLSDFMFFPSRYEGFGLVILEAMACGLPVFTGEVGIAKKIYIKDPFADLKLPEFLDREDLISEIIQKIYYLKANDERRRHISEEGIKLVEEAYNINVWQTKMLKALDLA